MHGTYRYYVLYSSENTRYGTSCAAQCNDDARTVQYGTRHAKWCMLYGTVECNKGASTVLYRPKRVRRPKESVI